MTREAQPPTVDGRLTADLRAELQGEVRDDPGVRAMYSTDASNYRQVPIAVAWPRTTDDVVAAVDIARRYAVPVLPRGGGTGLAGQTCNEALVIDCSRHLNRVLEIDADQRLATVEPGVILDRLREQAEQHHLTFGPDPATHDRCTLGGMIGNDSCGVHSVMAGKTVDNVERLDVLLYDGTRMSVGLTTESEYARVVDAGGRPAKIYVGLRSLRDAQARRIRERYPTIPRRVSGYNLDQLLPEHDFHLARALVGTEGTCATVLSATVRLVHSPPARVLVAMGFPDVFEACDAVPDILPFGPIGLEGMDHHVTDAMRRRHMHTAGTGLLPAGHAWLLAEFGADTPREASAAARRLMRRFDGGPAMLLFEERAAQRQVWEARESGLGATSVVPGEPAAWPGWEDSAVPPERMGAYLRDLRRMLDSYGYRGAFYGHFGQGCLHTRISFDLVTVAGIKRFRSFMEDAADLVVSYGGSLSGEHGDGQARGELLERMYGPELVDAFRDFKHLWDPDNRMNPGKVVDARSLDADLRLGPGYHPAPVRTTFTFALDGGSFADATLRCVGVGKCRREDGGVMCPSYMVTRDEEHSTRGRARLLFEMLQGDVVKGGWRDEHVREALDLCLACKGCKSDCPASVDMATYKAEFMSQHYKRRLRPRAAYAMGLIPWWSRLAGAMPRTTNAVTHRPLLAKPVKWAGGVAAERDVPRFAERSFRRWWSARPPAGGTGPGTREVILWPDCFNDHFHPGTAQAAVSVLEQAGYRVIVPDQWVCCGRPLYDFGMLTMARRLLRRTLRILAEPLRAGVPVVGLEPSCMAVFRDELPQLLPDDTDARRLAAQSFVLSELLNRHTPGWQPPAREGRALVQRHCHQHAVIGFDDEETLLRMTGLDVEILDSGCCGMAGSFGFEAGDRYRVAVEAGERVLLPAVRAAAADTLVLADGFSCREQIRQGTGRTAVHLAELLAPPGSQLG